MLEIKKQSVTQIEQPRLDTEQWQFNNNLKRRTSYAVAILLLRRTKVSLSPHHANLTSRA